MHHVVRENFLFPNYFEFGRDFSSEQLIWYRCGETGFSENVKCGCSFKMKPSILALIILWLHICQFSTKILLFQQTHCLGLWNYLDNDMKMYARICLCMHTYVCHFASIFMYKRFINILKSCVTLFLYS